jgi:hypothetical protein
MSRAPALPRLLPASSHPVSLRSRAGHKGGYFTAADDLIRGLTYVSACRWLPPE